MICQRATSVPMLRTFQRTFLTHFRRTLARQLATLALLAGAGASAQQPSTVIVDGTAYPLASGEQLPEWLQVEIVLFRHTAAVDERPRRDRQLSYPAPLVELADPTALAEQRAALAAERGVAVLGKQLPARRHNRWQQALIDDLNTLYNPYYTAPSEPAAEPTPAVDDNSAEQSEGSDSAAVSLADLQIEPSYWQLRPAQLTLRDSARAIGRRDDYQLLSHFGWRQPAEQSSPWLAVAGGQPLLGRHPLEGAIRLVKSRFNHIEAKLWWAQLDLTEAVEPLPGEPGEAAIAQPPAAVLAELGKPPLALPPLPESLAHRLTATREPAPLPTWSIVDQLLQPNAGLRWATSASITADWIVAAEPFRLTARIVADRPGDGDSSNNQAIATPLALDHAYRRLTAATRPIAPAPTPSQAIDVISVELPDWPRAPAATTTAGTNTDSEFSTATTAPNQRLLAAPASARQERPVVAQELQVAELWSITQRRRVDAGSDYYLDHPVVSMIVRVTRVDPEFTSQAGAALPAAAAPTIAE